jgi:hypothetical protein
VNDTIDADVEHQRTLALTPFDFVTKQILSVKDSDGLRPSLGYALKAAVSFESPELIQMVFSHPNEGNISAEEAEGSWRTDTLTDAMATASVIEKPELVRAIFSHRNAAKITAEGDFGLAGDLTRVSGTNPKIVRMILSHPNAVNIPVEGHPGIRAAIKMAEASGEQESLDMLSAFLKKIEDAAPPVVELPISPEDKAALLQIKEAIGSEGGYSISMRIIRSLSAGVQRRIYEQLCRVCGTPTGNIQFDSFGHILQNPLSLLPIINQLIK